MATPLIRYTRKDAMRLSYAVREFNKKIRSLEGLEKRYAPEEVTYQNIKSRIVTRREYNRVLKALKRFKRKGQEDLVSLGDGNIISKWERHEVKMARSRALPSLYLELNEAYRVNPLARFGMKSERISEIEKNIRDLENLENLNQDKFDRVIDRVQKIGIKDYDLYRDSIYMTNYLKGLKDKQFKSFKNFDIFYNHIKKLRPDEFFDFINRSTIMSDLFIWYDTERGEVVYSGFASNEDAFNTGLEQLGLLT